MENKTPQVLKYKREKIAKAVKEGLLLAILRV